MPTLKFDREKYIRIMKSKGISAALTALHEDTAKLEHQAFESEGGFQPELWEQINEVKKFSRELWEMDLQATPT